LLRHRLQCAEDADLDLRDHWSRDRQRRFGPSDPSQTECRKPGQNGGPQGHDKRLQSDVTPGISLPGRTSKVTEYNWV
jgi:hypothetical protein